MKSFLTQVAVAVILASAQITAYAEDLRERPVVLPEARR